MKKYFSWVNFAKLVCGVSAVLLFVSIIVKLASPTALAEIKLETLLLALGIVILFPYISQLEAFGVKVEVRKQVDELAARMQALPDYLLGSEFHTQGDYAIAEQSYRKSLEQCAEFWPAILGIGAVYHDQEEYARAIVEYRKVLELDKDNVYSFNNLAEVYLLAPAPIKDAQKALEMAERALQIVPSLGSALYYKAEALNELGRHEQALPILKGMLAGDTLPTQRHWVRYELAVANSALGRRVPAAHLDQMLFDARDNGEGRRLLMALAREDEQERFDAKDRSRIRQFLEKNRNYL